MHFLEHFDQLCSSLKRQVESSAQLTTGKRRKERENYELERIGDVSECDHEAKRAALQALFKRLFDSPILAYLQAAAKQVCEDVNKADWRVLDARNLTLDRVAALALVRFMCADEQLCAASLGLAFSLLKNKAVDAIIKSNILIGLGDLFHRFPNILGSKIGEVYLALEDPDVRVRKTCLMVVTHLVLNDMLKVCADIANVAVLLQDPDLML